jgi:hypothetical protein
MWAKAKIGEMLPKLSPQTGIGEQQQGTAITGKRFPDQEFWTCGS